MAGTTMARQGQCRSCLPSKACDQLRAEVPRAAVELSEVQLIGLTDALHGVIRLGRPG